MAGMMFTQAACRRAMSSRAMRYACSSVPTVVTTTIARMAATLLHRQRGRQCGAFVRSDSAVWVVEGAHSGVGAADWRWRRGRRCVDGGVRGGRGWGRGARAASVEVESDGGEGGGEALG